MLISPGNGKAPDSAAPARPAPCRPRNSAENNNELRRGCLLRRETAGFAELLASRRANFIGGNIGCAEILEFLRKRQRWSGIAAKRRRRRSHNRHSARRLRTRACSDRQPAAAASLMRVALRNRKEHAQASATRNPRRSGGRLVVNASAGSSASIQRNSVRPSSESAVIKLTRAGGGKSAAVGG